MAQVSPFSPRPPSSVAVFDALPSVRLELRHRAARPVLHEVTDLGFLIGSVPGCDLRLPGTDLPPVLCLITRHAGGAALRKLVATQPILVNGQPFGNGSLEHGDLVTLGSVELIVQVTAAPATQTSDRDSRDREQGEGSRASPSSLSASAVQDELTRLRQERQAFEADQKVRRQELETLARQLDLRQQQLEQQTQELETDRVIWYQRREEIEQECQQRAAPGALGKEIAEREQDVSSAQAEVEQRQQALEQQREELIRQQLDLEAREKQLALQQQELAGVRQELADIRQQLYDRYRERRDRLAGLQEAINRAGRKMQERKRQIDTDTRQSLARLQEQEARQVELEKRENELAQARQLLAEQNRLLTAREQELQSQDATRAADLARLNRLQAKAAQLLEMQQRLAVDRQAVRERETNLAQAEQAREALQEQLRRRSEELAARQRTLAEQARKQAEEISAVETRRVEIEHERRQTEERLAAFGRELEGRSAELERLRGDLAQREERFQRRLERLKQAGRKFGAARKSLCEERSQWKAAQQEAARTRAEIEAARREALALQQQLPALMLRAQAAAEHLAEVREQLREHLRELHAYAHHSQESVESVRSQVQGEAEQMRQQEQGVHRAWDEHRLAVAAFRQQLIEWQGQLTEMKQSLAQGETRLERRHTQVDEQPRQLDETSTQLAQQAEELQAQERVLAAQRQEMERHLEEMREWYRRKLRELSERRQAENGQRNGVERGSTHERIPYSDAQSRAPALPRFPVILSLTDEIEIEPVDRKLGELLRSLNLVDAETLTVLLVEARSQHRSLRQALLAGGYLTLYQMALIETGNLDGLVLGPLRVIDRLRVSRREAVYRVFDPRRDHEAVLRQLTEAEMEDAVHPDEFRQRFTRAASVRHPHLAATLEVQEIGGRPAVLQEWLTGLQAGDWLGLAAAPGVWFRLLCQAALGLHTAHQAGLIHGHLQPGSFLLTGEGILKLCGLGEPLWLVVPALADKKDADVATDLAELGRIAAAWTAPAGRRKGAPVKPLPAPLQAILHRLCAETADLRYADAAALLHDLEQAGAAVPPNAEAWERLLHHVREPATQDAELRQSA